MKKGPAVIKEEIEHHMDEITERLKTIDFHIYPRRRAKPKTRDSSVFNSEFAASVRRPDDVSQELAQKHTVKLTEEAVQELVQVVDRKNLGKMKKPQTINSGFEAFRFTATR